MQDKAIFKKKSWRAQIYLKSAENHEHNFCELCSIFLIVYFWLFCFIVLIVIYIPSVYLLCLRCCSRVVSKAFEFTIGLVCVFIYSLFFYVYLEVCQELQKIIFVELLFSFLFKYKGELVSAFHSNCISHFESQKFKPIVDCVLSLDDVAEAHQRMDNNINKGKIVLKVRNVEDQKEEL